MIYEMRTYDLKPRSQHEFLKRFGEAYEKRRRLSELAAFWTTEIGPLNQVIHVSPCNSLDQRMAVRKQAIARGNWPPKLGEGADHYATVAQETKILVAAPFSPLS